MSLRPCGCSAARLQPHQIDDVDDADFHLRQVLAQDRDRGEHLQGRRVAAAGHHDVGFRALIVARPLPDADALVQWITACSIVSHCGSACFPATTTLT